MNIHNCDVLIVIPRSLRTLRGRTGNDRVTHIHHIRDSYAVFLTSKQKHIKLCDVSSYINS